MPATSRSRKIAKRNRQRPYSIRDAANDRAKELQERPIEVHESGLEEKITLSVEQAAQAGRGSAKSRYCTGRIDGTKSAQKAVDDLRAETPAEVRQPQQIEAEPDIEKVLSHPKVRDAISAKVTEAETQRQHFETSVQEVGKMRIAALAADFPELVKLPLEPMGKCHQQFGENRLTKGESNRRQIAGGRGSRKRAHSDQIAKGRGHQGRIHSILGARE